MKRGPHRVWYELQAKDKASMMSKFAGDLNICERGLVEVFLDWKFDPRAPPAHTELHGLLLWKHLLRSHLHD